MFIMTAEKADNGLLEEYAIDRGWGAKVFVGPYAISYNDVEVCPSGFLNASSVQWVAFYGFEWVDGDNDGQCDAAECRQIAQAHSNHFLTRVFDIDDYREADAASRGPFTGGSGYANFIAEDHPWLYHGDPDDGYGYGEYPDGIYPY